MLKFRGALLNQTSVVVFFASKTTARASVLKKNYICTYINLAYYLQNSLMIKVFIKLEQNQITST